WNFDLSSQHFGGAVVAEVDARTAIEPRIRRASLARAHRRHPPPPSRPGRCERARRRLHSTVGQGGSDPVHVAPPPAGAGNRSSRPSPSAASPSGTGGGGVWSPPGPIR